MNTQTKERKPLDVTLKPVESSQVKEVGYHPESNTLVMRFKHGAGATYEYPGVSQAEYDELLKAESIGSHFGKHFKTRSFNKFLNGKHVAA